MKDDLTFKELAQGLLFLAALIASCIAMIYLESNWYEISAWIKGVCFGA